MHAHTHMDRTIFLTKVSTLATSLYILVCQLLVDELSPTLARIRKLWNGSDRDLAVAAEELVKEGILVPVDLSQDDKRWWVFPSTQWYFSHSKALLFRGKKRAATNTN